MDEEMVNVKKTTVKDKLSDRMGWLTVAEAAIRLSSNFNEEISEADIYTFALNGHLELSIYFAQGAWSLCQDYEDVPDSWNGTPSIQDPEEYVDPVDLVHLVKRLYQAIQSRSRLRQ